MSKKEWLIDKEKLYKQLNNLGLRILIYENFENQHMQTETIKWDNFKPNSNRSDSRLTNELVLQLVKESNWQNHSLNQNLSSKTIKITLILPILRRKLVFVQDQLQERLCLKNPFKHEKQKLDEQLKILMNNSINFP